MIYRDILIKNKVHNILIDKYIKRYIPLFAFISQKIYQTKKELITSNLKLITSEKAQGRPYGPQRWIFFFFFSTNFSSLTDRSAVTVQR